MPPCGDRDPVRLRIRVSHQCVKVFHHHQSFTLALVQEINFYQPTSTSLHTYKLDKKHCEVHIFDIYKINTRTTKDGGEK